MNKKYNAAMESVSWQFFLSLYLFTFWYKKFAGLAISSSCLQFTRRPTENHDCLTLILRKS